MQKKNYPRNITFIAGAVIVIEWVCVAVVLVLILVSLYKVSVPESSVMRMGKRHLQFTVAQNLPHFYEWKPNQTIIHERDWLPKTVTAETNNDGLIGDTDYQTSKPEGAFRILALGDSFTEGPYVEHGATYPKKLEKKLNTRKPCPGNESFEVLNFGVGGYDIEYAAHRFLHRGIKYNPDLILWFLKDDDFFDLAEASRARIDKYMSELPAEVKNDMTKFEKYQENDEELRDPDVRLWEKVNNIVRKELLRDKDQKEFLSIQTEAVQRVTQATDKPVVLFTFINTQSAYKVRMKLWSNMGSNTRFFDGVRDVTELNATFSPHDGHPNEKGYEIIVEDIYRFLERGGLLCAPDF